MPYHMARTFVSRGDYFPLTNPTLSRLLLGIVRISLTIFGGSPSAASSTNSGLGFVMNTRPMASICRSPPDNC